MPAGATVDITGEPRGDFYPVAHRGHTGWAFGRYLAPGAGSDTDDEAVIPEGPAYTTDRLNLRAGPSLGDRIVAVMPARALVRVTGSPADGFYPVTYADTTGWAFGQYLAPGKPPAEERYEAVTPLQRRVRALLQKRRLGHEWNAAARIISCESGWNPKQLNVDSNGHYSRGLWQINDKWYGALWKQYGLRWDDPIDNTVMAIKIYRGWDGWGAWSCYGATPSAARG